MPTRYAVGIFWRDIFAATMRRLRQLFATARNFRRNLARAEISFLRLSRPCQARVRLRLESCCRYSSRGGYGNDPSTTPQRTFHLWHWPRRETRRLAGDRTRAFAPGIYRVRPGQIRDVGPDASGSRSIAKPHADHAN